MNKTHYLLLFVLFYSNIQAQKFEFDILAKYQTDYQYENNDYSRETIIYANSKSDNFALYVYGNSEYKNAKLYDLEKMISYDFNVIETKINNEGFFEFEYLDSKMITPQFQFNKYELEYSSIITDSLNNDIKMEVFKNSKRKKPERTCVLKSKKGDTNLFHLFRFSMHPFEFKRQFNISENIIVESAKCYVKSYSKAIEYKLLYYKEVDLDIQIPTSNKSEK